MHWKCTVTVQNGIIMTWWTGELHMNAMIFNETNERLPLEQTNQPHHYHQWILCFHERKCIAWIYLNGNTLLY